jgi:regulator of protease activity HflC (stomatin/prohibitin superfamily)
MDVAMTLQYQINADKVTNIATQYGSLKTLEARITSIATAQTKSVLSKYKAMDIIADRASVSPAVEQAIKDAIGEEYCVNVQTVELINIDFSDAFDQAVEKKMIAEQEKLQAEYQNEQKIAQAKAEADAQIKKAEAEKEIAKAEAEAKKVQAEAEAEIKRIQAEAEAEAKKVAADAEAYANEKVAQSITDALLEKIYAENWDGKMPTVVGNGEYIIPSDMIK